MEDWQRKHISKNLDKLVDLTECNVYVLARLNSRGVLSKEDVDILESIGQTKGKSYQNYKLYQIVETREESYGLLIEAFTKSKQSGVLKILQKGEKANAKFCKPPNVLKAFLKQENKSVLLWAVTDVKLIKLWIQQTMLDDDDDFDVEYLNLEDLAETLDDPHESKLTCVVEADLRNVEDLLKKYSDSKKLEVTTTFPTWTDLTIKFQKELKQRVVRFLGQETKFEDLFAKIINVGFPMEKLTGNFLIDLINNKQPSLIQSKTNTVEESYIERKLHSRRMISVDSIENFPVEANDIFTFSGFDDVNEATRVLKQDYDISTTVLGKSRISSKFILLQTKGDYQLICMKAKPEQPVHLLHYVKDKQAFQWVNSRGNLNTIRSLMQSYFTEITEEKFIEAEIQNFGGHVVITGDPGMGKTSVLYSLTKININLNENTIVKYLVFRDFIIQFDLNQVYPSHNYDDTVSNMELPRDKVEWSLASWCTM